MTNLLNFLVIDLGSSAIRFELYQGPSNSTLNNLNKDLSFLSRPRSIFYRRFRARLADGFYQDNIIKKESLDRVIGYLQSAKKDLLEEGFRIDHVAAVTTSVLRDAINQSEVIEEIKIGTGFEFKVLSGQEEAELISVGVLANQESFKDFDFKKSFFIIDIGGGSTEIIFIQDEKVKSLVSLDLGSLRAVENFGTPPLSQKMVSDMESLLSSQIGIKVKELGLTEVCSDSAFNQALGSSGAIRTISKIFSKESPDGSPEEEPFSLTKIDLIIDSLIGRSSDEIMSITAVDQKKADGILHSAVILRSLVKAFKLGKIHPSKYSLRHGIIASKIKPL